LSQSIARAGPAQGDFRNLLHETDSEGEIVRGYTNAIDEEFGDLISEYGADGTTYHQFNAQASTDALLDEAGDVTARLQYRPLDWPAPAEKPGRRSRPMSGRGFRGGRAGSAGGVNLGLV